jgi:hypothetical protein
MSVSNNIPPAAVVFIHEVADWDKWKACFEGHEDARKAAGFVGHQLNRGLENPNLISIYLGVSDLAKAKEFSTSSELASKMAEAGVKGAPTIIWMKPVVQQIVWDREVPAMMLSCKVANFDAWLKTYNASDAVREKGGIIGHAASQSLDDPSNAVVYHQAESFDTLKTFVASPELKEAMEKAGVIGAPQVSYMTSGWAKRP